MSGESHYLLEIRDEAGSLVLAVGAGDIALWPAKPEESQYAFDLLIKGLAVVGCFYPPTPYSEGTPPSAKEESAK